MKDRFRFRAFYHNPYEEDDCDNKKMFYDAENTYDYLNGVPASSFGDIIDSDFWTVEQCTGLKDKNGKLIYEGDICRIKGTYYDCDYKDYIDIDELEKISSLEKFFGEAMVKGVYSALGCENLSVEVIGNIHENPELLKESK